MQNLPYLFAVYTITWVAFFIYVFFLNGRMKELRREIDDLKEELKETSGRSVSVSPPAPKRPGT